MSRADDKLTLVAKPVFLGEFRELRAGEADSPSLRDAIEGDADPDEGLIAQYLDEGSVLAFFPGVAAVDVLDPGESTGRAPHLMTDGVRCWYGDFSYYVLRYHVRIPVDVVEAMRSSGWHPPPLSHGDLCDLEEQWFPEVASESEPVDFDRATWLAERPRGWQQT